MPRVSIVLPFRNSAATLNDALASVREQTFTDWELLAIDDSSTDGSPEIVRRAFAGDPRLRLLPNAHTAGVSGASLTASDHARGEWLVRMDSDDVSHPERIARQLAASEKNLHWDVIGCRVEIPNPLGDGMLRHVEWTNSLTTPEEIAAARFIENPLVHPSAMMRRSSVDAVGGYRQVEWAEDHDLWLRLMESGAVFAKIPETLLQWRDSPARLTRSDAAYGDRARHRMRAHYLARLPSVREHGVAIAGAGPIGKELAQALMKEGVAVHGFFEVNPRRIGEIIHGIEVVDSSALGSRWREAILLSAVGVPGGREKVRTMAVAAGFHEGQDFWCVC
jgi:glycosyltransferase involved in cell wall biosynthesis